jgi:CRP-like cAMP-binding protein
MFVITRGAVKVQIPGENYQKTINHLKRNDFFGEMSLLTGRPRTATVIAEEETEVLQIQKECSETAIRKQPAPDVRDLRDQRRTPSVTRQGRRARRKRPYRRTRRGVLFTLKKFFGMN